MPPPNWNIEQANHLYGVNRWGGDHFVIDDKGELRVKLLTQDQSVSLLDVIQRVSSQGFQMPILLRVANTLDERIQLLHETFRKAIARAGYQGIYKGVFPIKVNQQKHVVEHIAGFGQKYHHGLEVGSKAELLAALSLLKDPESFLILNGYKDSEFVDIGLYAQQLGLNCIFVLELEGELDLVLERSELLGVKAKYGVRMRLSTQTSGQWSESSGDRSVFGLSASQVIGVVDKLRLLNKLDQLEMLHYHIGSQIPEVRHIRSGISEAVAIYKGLCEEGARMGIIDLGGGLGVDYDGSLSNNPNSRNYSWDEYCDVVVDGIQHGLAGTDISHPTIVTESGRATVAYSSILLFNILDRHNHSDLPQVPKLPDESIYIEELSSLLTQLNQSNYPVLFAKAKEIKSELENAFAHDRLTLRQRAGGEALYTRFMCHLSAILGDIKSEQIPDSMKGFKDPVDVYYGNFSLFQSLPDSWAIHQVFPVMPIHRLHEKPTEKAILSDITCDCDGKLDQFLQLEDTGFPVHRLKTNQEYYMGVFLVGAYQETLGDLHNLLGDTHVLTIEILGQDHFEIVGQIEGDRVSDVLSYVEYDSAEMMNRFTQLAASAVANGRIEKQVSEAAVDFFQSGLNGYTYFERD